MATPAPEPGELTRWNMLNDADKILLATYRKAFETGKVEVTFKSPQVATRMRFMMYRLARVVKDADPLEFDERDRLAVAEVTLSLDGAKLICRNESMSDAFQQLKELVGNVELRKDEDERVSREAMEKFKSLGLMNNDDAQT
jgi:hypothetical protein